MENQIEVSKYQIRKEKKRKKERNIRREKRRHKEKREKEKRVLQSLIHRETHENSRERKWKCRAICRERNGE